MNHSLVHTVYLKLETGCNAESMNEWLVSFHCWRVLEILLVKSLIFQCKFLSPRKVKELARGHTDNETAVRVRTPNFWRRMRPFAYSLHPTAGDRHVSCLPSGDAISFLLIPSRSFSSFLYFADFNLSQSFIPFILFPLGTTGKTRENWLNMQKARFQ